MNLKWHEHRANSIDIEILQFYFIGRALWKYKVYRKGGLMKMNEVNYTKPWC